MTDKEIRVHVRNAMIDELAFASLEIREREGSEWHLMRGVPTGAHGSIEIESTPGRGVRVIAVLPVGGQGDSR